MIRITGFHANTILFHREIQALPVLRVKTKGKVWREGRLKK